MDGSTDIDFLVDIYFASELFAVGWVEEMLMTNHSPQIT